MRAKVTQLRCYVYAANPAITPSCPASTRSNELCLLNADFAVCLDCLDILVAVKAVDRPLGEDGPVEIVS